MIDYEKIQMEYKRKFNKAKTVADKFHVLEEVFKIEIPSEVITCYEKNEPITVSSIPSYLIPIEKLFDYNIHLLGTDSNDPVLFEIEDYKDVWDNTYYEYEASWSLETLSYTVEEDPMDKLLHGIFIIYHQGCSFYEAIILDGKYKGRHCFVDTNYECGAPELIN